MNKIFTILLLIPNLFFAQDISPISVGAGGSITVSSGANLNIAGLELEPSSDLFITETDVGRTLTAISSNNNTSVNRVYTSTNLISDFTGISSKYETPHNSDYVIDTSKKNIDSCVKEIMKFLKNKYLNGKL